MWDASVPVMRKAFQMFDTTKCGFIETLKISTILNTMGQLFEEAELQTLIEETDPEGKSSKPCCCAVNTCSDCKKKSCLKIFLITLFTKATH